MEQTFLMIKPDAVLKGVVGEIVSTVERSGFRIVRLASRTLTREDACRIYDVHAGKSFLGPLVDFITSGPTVGIILEASDAVSRLRETVGATDPAQAGPGTIRARFGSSLRENAVHAADSADRFAHESAVYFGAGDAPPG